MRHARLGACLAPFQQATLADFAEFLINAERAVATGSWPAPGKKPAATRTPRAAKPAKPTVEELAQKIMELYERAAGDPNLDYATIDAFIDSINPRTKPELVELAKQVDVTVAKSDSKPTILTKMRDSIKDRKNRAGRTNYGAERTGEAQGTFQLH